MRRPLCFGCLLFIMICVICLQIFNIPLTDFTPWEGKNVIVTGEIVGKERKTTASGPVMLVTLKPTVIPQGFPPSARGKIQCYLKEDVREAKLGSTVQVQGEVACFERATNPGQFSQAEYYQILKIDYKLYEGRVLAVSRSFSRYREGLYAIKEACGRVLDECFTEENATVMRTMLLGETGQTDPEIKEMYKRNGIIHILAISGLHISIIGMSLYRLLRRIAIPIPLAAPAAAAVMYSYGVMTGMSTSSLRAIVMFGMHMTARLLGRTYDLLTALAAAAILILLEQPLYLYHSGFLFSFLAVLAISLFAPAMNHSLPIKIPLIKKSVQALLSGCCISAATLPIYLIFYYQFPPYSILMNLIVIPLMSILMITGILTMLVGCICIPIGKITAVISSLILEFYQNLCTFCDQLPLNNLIIGKPQMWQIITYGTILVVLILFHKRMKIHIRYLILTVGILLLVLKVPVGLTITLLDVGQGDCIYIQSPSGGNYLIDGGSSSTKGSGEYRILPYLKSQGVRQLEAVFITHPDQDHYNAFPEMLAAMDTHGIPIKTLILPAVHEGSRNEEYRSLEEMAAAAGIKVRYISRGQGLQEGDFTLQCLHPETAAAGLESNAYSTVLLLKYQGFSALFTGDVEGAGEQALVRYIAQSRTVSDLTVLKVSHHGSRNSTAEEFLRLVNPAYAVISAGYGNSYGHPHKELIERLKNNNTKIYITYQRGAVTFRTNGEKMTVESFRQQ